VEKQRNPLPWMTSSSKNTKSLCPHTERIFWYSSFSTTARVLFLLASLFSVWFPAILWCSSHIYVSHEMIYNSPVLVLYCTHFMNPLFLHFAQDPCSNRTLTLQRPSLILNWHIELYGNFIFLRFVLEISWDWVHFLLRPLLANCTSPIW
jgi:hypothetical protein